MLVLKAGIYSMPMHLLLKSVSKQFRVSDPINTFSTVKVDNPALKCVYQHRETVPTLINARSPNLSLRSKLPKIHRILVQVNTHWFDVKYLKLSVSCCTFVRSMVKSRDCMCTSHVYKKNRSMPCKTELQIGN